MVSQSIRNTRPIRRKPIRRRCDSAGNGYAGVVSTISGGATRGSRQSSASSPSAPARQGRVRHSQRFFCSKGGRIYCDFNAFRANRRKGSDQSPKEPLRFRSFPTAFGLVIALSQIVAPARFGRGATYRFSQRESGDLRFSPVGSAAPVANPPGAGKATASICSPTSRQQALIQSNKNGAVTSAVLVHRTRGAGPLRLALAGATRSGSAGVGSLVRDPPTMLARTQLKSIGDRPSS